MEFVDVLAGLAVLPIDKKILHLPALYEFLNGLKAKKEKKVVEV